MLRNSAHPICCTGIQKRCLKTHYWQNLVAVFMKISKIFFLSTMNVSRSHLLLNRKKLFKYTFNALVGCLIEFH